MTSYFHLSSIPLLPGSIIAPGNFGRVVGVMGWRHGFALREHALEEMRKARFTSLPSRLNAAFAFRTAEEALRFKAQNSGFSHIQFDAHLLYRVTLREPKAPTFVADWRLAAPCGPFGIWPEVYWLGIPRAPIPGVQWPYGNGTSECGEVLTLSHLVIEERLDAP